MKKLNKLKLNEVAVLSDGEMKKVFGGQSTGAFGTGVFECWCVIDDPTISGGPGYNTGYCVPVLVRESELDSFCPDGESSCQPYHGEYI